MNDKKKYEFIIIAIFLIGAVLSCIFNIYSLIIYLFSLFIIYKGKNLLNIRRGILVN